MLLTTSYHAFNSCFFKHKFSTAYYCEKLKIQVKFTSVRIAVASIITPL